MMGKKLIILLIICSLLSTQIAVAADSAEEVILNDLGLLLNISEAELDATLTRDVGVTMILKALGYTQEDADNASANPYFTDVSDWAKGWAELAYDVGITTGIGNQMFNPKGTLTEKEFVAFQLRALEYDVNDAWNNAGQLAVEAGLKSNTSVDDINYTKREAADVMYNALSATLVSDDTKLIDKLIDEGIVDEDKAISYDLVNTAFTLEHIDVISLKMIRLEFSDVVKESTIDNTTIKVYDGSNQVLYDAAHLNGINFGQYALVLKEDKKTVDIVFGKAFAEGSIIKVEIDDLKNDNGEDVDKATKTIEMTDETKPEVVSMEVINPKLLRIEFTESAQHKVGTQVYDNIKIDGVKLLATGSLNYDQTVLTLELKEALEEGKHSFYIDDILDYAGLLSASYTKSIDVEDDNEAPYIVSATATNREEVLIEFNEIFVEGEGKLHINGKTYRMDDEDDLDLMSIDDNLITVELTNPLPASAATSGLDAEFEDFEDMMENTITSRTLFNIMAEYDNVSPTVEVSVDENNDILVSFSEDVQDFGVTNFAITEYDEEDDEDDIVGVAYISQVGSSRSEYKIRLSDPYVNSKEYKIIIKGVKDLSVFQNRIAEYEQALNMLDKKQPEIKSVKYLGGELLRITFTEAMNYSDIVDPDNYEYNDVSESTTVELSDVDDYTIEVDPDNEYVDITIEGLSKSDKIIVDRVKDLAGLVLKDFGDKNTLQEVDEFNASDLEARLIDTKTIKLIASNGHEFGTIYGEDFMMRTSSGDSNTHYVYSAYIDSEDASIAYLVLSGPLDADAKYNNKKQYLYMNDEIITADIYDQELEIKSTSPLAIEDYVRPVSEIDDNDDETIIIEFSEVVTASSNQSILNDLLLKDEDGDYVTLTIGGNTTLSGGNSTYNFFDTITITGLTSGEVYTVELKERNIDDEENNLIVGIEETKVTVE